MNDPGPRTIHAPGNQGFVAAGDIFLGDKNIIQETLYSEPQLDDVKPPDFPSPPAAEGLTDLLWSERLLVLAGQELDDRGGIARHLAWRLREILRRDAPSRGVVVREWYRSSDAQKLESAFHETETTVLLLPQIQPHHVGGRLEGLQRLLRSRGHFAVITTDTPLTRWGLDGSDAFWQDLSWESYYGQEFLADLLLQRLESFGQSLPEGLLPEGLSTPSSRTLLVPGASVGEVVAKLRQPDRIVLFLRWLLAHDTALSSRQVGLRISQLAGDRQSIVRWYCQFGRREQLLALGLSLFDGLPDDMTFSALEMLIENSWRSSDPLLAQFDYQDLDEVSAYFKLMESGKEGARIGTQSTENRQEVLGVAWRFQRRHLLLALPLLTQMIKRSSGALPEEETAAPSESASASEHEKTRAALLTATRTTRRDSMSGAQDLYSTPRRNLQLQQALIESLSEIALLSIEDAEPWLLHLALDGSPKVQTPVAKALAAWRGRDQSRRLFSLLGRWWMEGCRPNSLQSLADRIVRQGVNPGAALRSTVALAVGFAAQYDPPNRLDSKLMRMLGPMAEDRNPSVRNCFLSSTLPTIVTWHLGQLDELLREKVLVKDDAVNAVALGIATAYRVQPHEALEVLVRWRAMAQRRPREAQDHSVTFRERLLATVALAYGHMDPGGEGETFSTEQLFPTLRNILATETHPYVRKSVILAIGLQMIQNFRLAAPMQQELVSEVTLADRSIFISVLTETYVRQRRQLEGGHEILSLGDDSYSIWIYSRRPLTPIEELLYDWLQDDSRPVAQQIAVETFAAFHSTRLENEERALIARRLSTPAPASVSTQTFTWTWNPDKMKQLGFFGSLSLFFSALGDREIREALSPTFAEVLAVRERSGPWTLDGLFQRWSSHPKNEITQLTKRLRSAVDIYGLRWLIVFGAAFVLWIIIALAKSGGGQ